MAIERTTITYKGRTVDLDGPAAEGMIRDGILDATGGTPKPTRSQEALAAAVRWITSQGGQYLAADEAYPCPRAGFFYDPDEPTGRRDFLPAPDLEAIARQLIEDDEALGHLANYRVVYLWKRQGGKRQGQPVLGKCTKASGPAKHFAGATWIVWLAADWTETYGLTRRQVEAAVHHELSHAGEREVERYGLWRLPLQEVAPAFRQLDMFAEGGQS